MTSIALRSFHVTRALIATLILCVGAATLRAQETEKLNYPDAIKCDQIDDYFGTKVHDPYRWMEVEKTPELEKWIQAENELTYSLLDKIPLRESLRKEMTECYDYAKQSAPYKRGERYFFSKNSGLQNQSVQYYKTSLDGEETLILDPNELSDDGTVALSSIAISKNGRYYAYSTSTSGSDWRDIYVIDLETGKHTCDHIEWAKFTEIAWFHDGFFYSRYDAPPKGQELTAKNEYQKIYYHKLGQSQDQDVLVFEDRDNPSRNCTGDVDDDENWLFVYQNESTYGARVLFAKLTDDAELDKLQWQTLYPDFDAETGVVAVQDDLFYLLTDYQAPKRRLVSVDPEDPTPNNWKDVIPESNVLLESVTPVADRLIAVLLEDAADKCLFYDYNGKELGQIELPTLGVVGLSAKKGSDELFYTFTSFVYPSTVYRCDVKTGASELYWKPQTSFNPEDYVTQRLWYESTDDVKAPIFITYRKDLPLDQPHSTILYGYGGFNISMKPSFKPTRIPYLNHDGIYAVAILRGGGEYGEQWHKDGTKLQKQNVFDDFISAAEFLIKNGYASNETLAINGGSNGGLLVGATLTQRPELFAAAVPQVGVLDMLRYHKFTIGWAWATDYGTSEESKEMFEYLLKYSPLHNVKPDVRYPATMVMTSDHDDRVVPAHSMKFAATLQANASKETPVIIRIESKAGHGAGKPTAKIIEEAVDMYSFILFYTTPKK
ncbi:MAG: prolyl oligopeptidase family serine peptidase [Planctomycetia bacterium]|nr:prolyl oligopeptidase family serine peptidase [Planctomycetia bacterium]